MGLASSFRSVNSLNPLLTNQPKPTAAVNRLHSGTIAVVNRPAGKILDRCQAGALSVSHFPGNIGNRQLIGWICEHKECYNGFSEWVTPGLELQLLNETKGDESRSFEIERTKYRNRSWRTPPVREGDVSSDGRLRFPFFDVGRQDGVILPIRLPQPSEPFVGEPPTGPIGHSG